MNQLNEFKSAITHLHDDVIYNIILPFIEDDDKNEHKQLMKDTLHIINEGKLGIINTWRHLPMMVQYRKIVKLWQDFANRGLVKVYIDASYYRRDIDLYLDDNLIHSRPYDIIRSYHKQPNFILPELISEKMKPFCHYRPCHYLFDSYYGVPYEFIPKNPNYEVKIIIVKCNDYVFKVPIDIKPELYIDAWELMDED